MPTPKPRKAPGVHHALQEVRGRMHGAHGVAEAAISLASKIQNLIRESIEGGGMFVFEAEAETETDRLIEMIKLIAMETLVPEPGHTQTQKRGGGAAEDAVMPHRQTSLLEATRSPKRAASRGS